LNEGVNQNLKSAPLQLIGLAVSVLAAFILFIALSLIPSHPLLRSCPRSALTWLAVAFLCMGITITLKGLGFDAQTLFLKILRILVATGIVPLLLSIVDDDPYLLKTISCFLIYGLVWSKYNQFMDSGPTAAKRNNILRP
jgi:hypothetical protein